MREIESPDLVLGIVGAGAMGTGIAQVAAGAGIRTLLHDARPEAAAAARQALADRLARRVADGRMAAAEREAMLAQVEPADALEDLADADVVIEAIIEDLAAKRTLFGQLEAIVATDTILASNTSSLPIGAIARGLAHPERVGGLHFFNPVPVMRLVEVIEGPDTTAGVMDRLVRLGERLGRQPVRVKDAPGFLVNLGGRAYLTEALAIVHERVAPPHAIDAVMRDCCGFRMGPFELLDLTGVDVNFPVTEFVHRSFFGDPRLRSTPLHRYMLETGQLGRKAGRGFYDYRSEQRPSPDAEVRAEPATRAAVPEPTPALMDLLGVLGLEVVADDGRVPLIAAPLGEDCAAFAARTGADHRRLVGVDVFGDTARRLTAMSAPGADPRLRDSVIARLAQGRAVTAIADSPGFIAQRMIAMVANLGCEMAQMGLARPEDIDLAMRLGLNYPKGPLEFAEAHGVRTIHRILSVMQSLTGDDRYRPSQWLRRRAQLGLPAHAT